MKRKKMIALTITAAMALGLLGCSPSTPPDATEWTENSHLSATPVPNQTEATAPPQEAEKDSPEQQETVPTIPEATKPSAETKPTEAPAETAPETRSPEPVDTTPPETEPMETVPPPTQQPAASEPSIPPATEPFPTAPPATEPEPAETVPPVTEAVTEPTQPPTESIPTEPAPTEPMATEPTSTEPIPTEPAGCSHDWVCIHHSEEGHWIAGVICDCGWVIYGNPDEVVAAWNVHCASFPPEEALFEHGGYGSVDEWIVDVPAYDEWICRHCGEPKP